MTAPSKVSGAPRNAVRARDVLRARRFPVSDGVPVEVVESGPSLPGMVASLACRLTIRPALAVCSYIPHLPLPFGIVDFASRVLLPAPGTIRATVELPHCHRAAGARARRAAGRRQATGGALSARRRVFDVRGQLAQPNRQRIVEVRRLAGAGGQLPADPEALGRPGAGRLPRRLPLAAAARIPAGADRGGRRLGRRLSGSCTGATASAGPRGTGCAGGDLAVAAAGQGAQAVAPEHQDRCDVSRPRHSTRCSRWSPGPRRKHVVDGKPEQLYEPLDHVEPGLPRTLIHVSGSEVLLHDARLAARALAAAGVPTEVRVWPRPDSRLPTGGTGGARGDALAAADRRVHPRGHRLVPIARLAPTSDRCPARIVAGRAARGLAAPETMYACGSRDTSVNSSEILHWFS